MSPRPRRGEVARAHPAVGRQRVGRGLRVAVVAAQGARSLHPELADLTKADLTTVVVDDPEVVPGEGDEVRADLERDAATELDHPVALDEESLTHGPNDRKGRARSHPPEALRQVFGHHVGARCPHADALQVTVGCARLVHQPVHRGHTHEHRGAAVLDRIEHLARTKAREVVHGHAGRGEPQQRGEAVDVRDRQRDDRFVTVELARKERRHPRQPQEPAVGQLDPLRLARRA